MRSIRPVALILVLWAAGTVRGQDGEQTPLVPSAPADEVAALRREIDSLKQRLDSGGFATPRLRVTPGAQPQLDSRVSAGYDLIFARPQMKESFRSTTLNPVTGDMRLHPFDFDFAPASRVWATYQAEGGVGVRARYWHYDHDGDPYSELATPTSIPGASAVTVMFPATIAGIVPGDLLKVTNSLQVQTIDLEGTRTLRFGQTELTAGAGLTYAQIEQGYEAEILSAAIPRALHFGRTFHGIGPSLGVTGRHPLGIAGLSAIGSFHAAFLFGEKTLQRGVVGQIPPGAGPPFVALNDSREVTGAFEAGIGLEWNVWSGDAGALAIRGMYEGQLWTETGAPTMTYLGFDSFSGGIAWSW